jgi:hypothetical protein
MRGFHEAIGQVYHIDLKRRAHPVFVGVGMARRHWGQGEEFQEEGFHQKRRGHRRFEPPVYAHSLYMTVCATFWLHADMQSYNNLSEIKSKDEGG